MKVLLILDFPSQTPCLAKFLQNSCSGVIAQNVLDQSYCRILLRVMYVKKLGMKLIFCLQINIRVSYNLVLLLLVVMARCAQSTK